MREARAFPRYIPASGDRVQLSIPSLSTTSSIVTFVTHREGGAQKRKVLLRCMTGPDDRFGSIQLIWKPSTGWFCWLGGKHYPNARVERV